MRIEQDTGRDSFLLDPSRDLLTVLLHVHGEDRETFLVELLMDLPSVEGNSLVHTGHHVAQK